MSDAGPPLVAISGPVLLGFLFNWGLLGILSVQVYFYFLAFPKDRRTTKTLVAVIYVLELTQTVLLTHDGFATYAIHFADVGFLSNMQLLPLSVPILGGLVSCAVQIHYGYLLRMLSGSRLLGLTVALFSVIQCTAAIVQGVQAFIINDISALATRAFASETVWLAGSAICDLIIACGMIIVLYRQDTKFPTTHTIITKLVRVVVETGFLTAISALIQMILFITLPDKPYFTCVGFVLSKLYSNSVLALLNSRIRIEGVHTLRSTAQATAGSSLAFYGQSAVSRRAALPSLAGVTRKDNNATRSRIIDVHIQREIEAWTDDSHMTPIDKSVLKNASSSGDLGHDSVLSKV